MSTENIKTVVQEKMTEQRPSALPRDKVPRVAAQVPLPPSKDVTRSHPICTAEGEAGSVPEAAMRASLGCGNPTALAKLAPGETVLDLGSGGGIDVLLSAPPCRSERQGVWSRHDRRDARARRRKQAASPDSRTLNSSKARSRTFPCPITP